MDLSTGTVNGVQNGSHPVRVVQPGLVLAMAGQSVPLASASNTITLTMQTNVELSGAMKHR
eukprot:1200551-Rhodomonas_salina.1